MNLLELNAIFRLRRDNDYNYQKIENTFVPAKGEACIVDTAQNGLRIKIGDGATIFKNLRYIDEDIATNLIIRGYKSDNGFYYDVDLSIPIETSLNKIYIDTAKNIVYIYDGVNYVPITSTSSAASAQTAGVMKLYQEIGSNIDGTMSQKAITDELNEKFELELDLANETLNFIRDLDE